MLRPRVIPCLLIKGGGLVKTVRFANPKYVGDPINAVRIFNEKGVDELVVLDIDATREGREPDYATIEHLASECRMPLCYGGGVKSVAQARRIIGFGVEKIAVSSAAVTTPALVTELANSVGAQSVVAILDAKRRSDGGVHEVWLQNGQANTTRPVSELAAELESRGAGEIVVNSIDQDGTMTGFDIELAMQVRSAISVPLTVLGGAGSFEHLRELVGAIGVVGAAAGSLFVFQGVHKAVLISYPSQLEKDTLMRSNAPHFASGLKHGVMKRSSSGRSVTLVQAGADLLTAVRTAMEQSGILARIKSSARVSLKPNLTYPYYKPGVTTSPAVMDAVLRVLSERTTNVAIVETDGGYGAWKAVEAFDGHRLYALCKQYGCRLVNLCDEPSEGIEFVARGRRRRVALPTRLLHETDVFITMPVPKIHCMTGLSLSYKNQWGCIPDTMRLRRHHIFDEAIVAINERLKPAVLGDGTFFLDRNGPMEGVPVRMDLVIAASDAGAFDRYVSELMGFPWERVRHLRVAAARGDMPTDLSEIACNVPPHVAGRRVFRLDRTARNWLALAGFKSRFVTWLGYESWFGTAVIHPVLYAIAGKPVQPAKPTTE